MDFEAIVREIKRANPIADVIGETYPLTGRGKNLRPSSKRGQGLNSLVVHSEPGKEYYVWTSRGEKGDVFTWIMKREGCDFKTAARILAERAGLAPPVWSEKGAAAALARRTREDVLTVAAGYFEKTLSEHQAALDYCCSRGWTDATVQAAGLGYTGSDGGKGLRGQFSMYEIDPASSGAKGALWIAKWRKMLVYPHVEFGRVVYLATRSIDPAVEKSDAHKNPPSDLLGDRQLYFNWVYTMQAESVLLVEGQADAVTAGQWRVPALAIAGCSVNQMLLKALARHETVYLGLDRDEAGARAAREIAGAAGPLTRIVFWPEGSKGDDDVL